jgi:hypothetical protein
MFSIVRWTPLHIYYIKLVLHAINHAHSDSSLRSLSSFELATEVLLKILILDLGSQSGTESDTRTMFYRQKTVNFFCVTQSHSSESILLFSYR